MIYRAFWTGKITERQWERAMRADRGGCWLGLRGAVDSDWLYFRRSTVTQQKPVGTNLSKAGRQDVLKESADKIGGCQRANSSGKLLAPPAVCDLNCFTVVTTDSPRAYANPVGVTTKICKRPIWSASGTLYENAPVMQCSSTKKTCHLRMWQTEYWSFDLQQL